MLLRGRFNCRFSLFALLLPGVITHEGHLNAVKMTSLGWNGIYFFGVSSHNEEFKNATANRHFLNWTFYCLPLVLSNTQAAKGL